MILPDPNQFRAARHLLGLSTQAVAADLRVGAATLNQLENGTVNARQDTITKIVEAYEARGIEFAEEGWVRLRPAS